MDRGMLENGKRDRISMECPVRLNNGLNYIIINVKKFKNTNTDKPKKHSYLMICQTDYAESWSQYVYLHRKGLLGDD